MLISFLSSLIAVADLVRLRVEVGFSPSFWAPIDWTYLNRLTGAPLSDCGVIMIRVIVWSSLLILDALNRGVEARCLFNNCNKNLGLIFWDYNAIFHMLRAYYFGFFYGERRETERYRRVWGVGREEATDFVADFSCEISPVREKKWVENP